MLERSNLHQPVRVLAMDKVPVRGGSGAYYRATAAPTPAAPQLTSILSLCDDRSGSGLGLYTGGVVSLPR